MSSKDQSFIPLSFIYLPSSLEAKGTFKDLFTTLRLHRSSSRTIKRSSFTAEDFGRDVFDAVTQRLEEYGYIKFEKGKRQAYSGHLFRVYLQRPLVRL